MSNLESVTIKDHVVSRDDGDRVMIYIDLNNIFKGARDRYPLYYVEIDYQKLVSRLAGFGSLAGVHVYDGTGKNGFDPMEEVHQHLRDLDFDVQLRVTNRERQYDQYGIPHLITIQKGVDGALMTQLLKDCFKDQFDIAVILSADRDFSDAVIAVREEGKTVECATFIDADFQLKRICNKYCDLDLLDIVNLYTKETYTPVKMCSEGDELVPLEEECIAEDTENQDDSLDLGEDIESISGTTSIDAENNMQGLY